jgi:hypothetical protein
MWWLHLSPGHGEFCDFVCARGEFVHQKCSNYALTNLLFGLCIPMWIIDPLITRPNPHLGTPTCPSTPRVQQVKEHIPVPFTFVVFTFGLAFLSYEEFGGVPTTFKEPWGGIICVDGVFPCRATSTYYHVVSKMSSIFLTYSFPFFLPFLLDT